MPTQRKLSLLCAPDMYKPVCILIMAHSHEELLMQLLNRLVHPQVLVFVHVDKKSQSLFDRLSTRSDINLVQNRINVQWAHLTQLLAMFSSYKEIKAKEFEFDHFLVISGQDYPTQSMDKLVSFLSANKGKSFISHVPLSKDGWASAMKRYRYHYYVRMEKLWRGLMMLTGIRRKFPFDLKPHGGAQWVNLAKPHMDYVIEFCDTHISLLNFMETVRFPEEMLFQTLLLNSKYSTACVNNDLRFVKWIHGKSNPEILVESDLPEIKNEKDRFFARKLDIKQSAGLIQALNNENS